MSDMHAAIRRLRFSLDQPPRSQPKYRQEPQESNGEIIAEVILRDGKIVVEPVPSQPK